MRLAGDDPLDLRPRLQTRWRIRAVPDWPNVVNVELVVDTTASPIVDAIERAASRAGVRLERLDEDGAA